MSSQGSLSPTVSSNALSTFAQAKLTLDRKLAHYQPSGHGDDAEDLLRIIFKYLPRDGQVNLAEDVDRCPDSGLLRQLAKSLDDGLLRPMLAHGGITPAITPSPDVRTITRASQSRLRKSCLARDGYRCVVSNLWNSDYNERPAGSIDAPSEAAHIVPFTLGVDFKRTMTMSDSGTQRFGLISTDTFPVSAPASTFLRKIPTKK